MPFEYCIIFGLLALYLLLLGIPALSFIGSGKNGSVTGREELPFTLIICARNEEKTLARCLKGIMDQHYDKNKLQIIFVNDASTDRTAVLATTLLQNSGIEHRIISNPSQKGKKKSIAYAMQFATHNHVILRDADTFNDSNLWLHSIAETFLTKKADMIIGPLGISDNQGALWALQVIENDILNVLAGGTSKMRKPFLCSGANLAFTRKIFEETGSFQSHIEIPSGDDIFFLEEVKKKKGKIIFIQDKEALVRTYPCYSFASLLRQRIRWASKTGQNKNILNTIVAATVLLTNCAFLFCLADGFLMPQNAVFGLFFVGLKLLIDILLLFLAFGLIRNKGILPYILPTALIYPVYSVIIAAGSLFMKPKWK